MKAKEKLLERLQADWRYSMESCEAAKNNGDDEDIQFYAGQADGLRAAIQIVKETLK